MVRERDEASPVDRNRRLAAVMAADAKWPAEETGSAARSYRRSAAELPRSPGADASLGTRKRCNQFRS